MRPNILFIMAVWLMVMGQVVAQNYFVAPEGSDANVGTSWAAAFQTIQKGIDTAAEGQAVAVSNGTYVLTTQLLLAKGITLQGFGGSANTIIDANLTGRIMVVSNAAAVLDGFTLRNGQISTAGFKGTGIYMAGGTIRNCVISGCTNTASAGQGIGVYMTEGILDTCVIENNSSIGGSGGALTSGGGIFMSGSGCLVTNCVIAGNQIGAEWMTSKGAGVYLSAGKLLASTVISNSLNQGRYVGGGGGVYVADDGIVSNCVISGNSLTCVDAITRGGGLYVDWGTVAGCVITNNNCNVNRSAGGGGGVFVAGSGTVRNCTIAWNSVPCVDPPVVTGGGGVYVDGGRVADCMVSNNSSSYYRTDPGTFGGGVRMAGSSLVERCVISGNYLVNRWHGARYGGGVACEGGVMRSCLIMGNTANSSGGGLYISGGTNENCTIVRNQCLADAWGAGEYGGVYWTNSPTIINAIVYYNNGGVENDILPVVMDLTNVTYSCAPSLTVGIGNVTGDPLFVDSGSSNGTGFVAGDYRLPFSSPCMDKGFSSGWMRGVLDLAGNSRFKGLGLDMGAYEFQVEMGTVIRIR